MRILALEPYYGGSHRAFLDGWIAHSDHAWTVLGLAPYKWKWRMRHAAITLAELTENHRQQGQTWDAIFCSDMLNLAEFRGLSHPTVGQLPSVVYFHENQLTYPVRHEDERDYHFVISNLITGLSAEQVWFNSDYHRREFLAALPGFLNKMPDYRPLDAVAKIEAKSAIHHPGIDLGLSPTSREPGPIHILWAARWEHDKNPTLFFEAIDRLAARKQAFRLSVIGEQFREQPAVFQQAYQRYREQIVCWGYQAGRDDYISTLQSADVIVSTANHEFFGITVAEAIAAGAWPMLPQRLAYPELLTMKNAEIADRFFYDGSAENLAKQLARRAQAIDDRVSWQQELQPATQAIRRFAWPRRASAMDAAIAGLVERG